MIPIVIKAANETGVDPVLSPPARRFRSKKSTNPWFRKLIEAAGYRGIRVSEISEPVPEFALLGARSCELHAIAIAIQDKVFLAEDHCDDDYSLRRENALIIAANCGQAGGTCFCVSMQTGPQATSDFDLALAEIQDDGPHRFLANAERSELWLTNSGREARP